MAHHDKGKSKRKGSSCRRCKPHKQVDIRGLWDKARMILEQKLKEARDERAT